MPNGLLLGAMTVPADSGESKIQTTPSGESILWDSGCDSTFSEQMNFVVHSPGMSDSEGRLRKLFLFRLSHHVHAHLCHVVSTCCKSNCWQCSCSQVLYFVGLVAKKFRPITRTYGELPIHHMYDSHSRPYFRRAHPQRFLTHSTEH